ncbi:MAG: winged helix-turn-helix domain-containing protein [Gammaproteobacteria bacterium]
MSTAGPEAILEFAGFCLDTRKRRLIGPDGLPVDLPSRAFETLLYLALHPHEVIEKHQLMKAVWPNSVVEENNLNQQISTLRKILGEAAGDPRDAGRQFIVTDARRGYRFVQDVHRMSSLPPAAPGLRESPSSDRNWRKPWRRALVAASALLIVAATYLLFTARESGRALSSGPPSIAVLPFADLSPNHDQGYFVDGLLTLRAPHVAANAGGTRNLEAYEAYLAARAVTNNVGSTRARDAIRLLEQAVELDPNFALAWAALAEGYTFAADFPPSLALPLTPVELQKRISRAAMRALELAPDAPQSLRSAGMVSMRNRDWAEAERRLRRAVELAGPNDYDANLLYAYFLMNVGRATEAIPYEERAMRAEPLLLRPVALRAALHEMRGELDEAEALMLASGDLRGQEIMRRQGLIMIRLARHDRSGLIQIGNQKGGALPCSSLNDPPRALAQLRESYAEATRSGASGQLIPVALFASLLGDQALALKALRALGPTTQSLFPMWRPALSEVRRQPGFEEIVRDAGLVDYWRASGNWGEFCLENAGGGVTCR